MKRVYQGLRLFLCIMPFLLCHTACGAGEVSFGREVFFGVKQAAEMEFLKERERPVQVAVGQSSVWILNASSKGSVYEREIDTGSMRNLMWQQGEQEMVMGISAVEDTLYACVTCGETVQVRKFCGDGQWAVIVSVPWEEAPEQMQPTMFFVDRAENSYFAKGEEIWQYSPESGQRTLYKFKESAAFLQEKEPGTVEAVTKSNGEIAFHFDSIAAGVSTNLLGGLWLTEEGAMYLVEQTADSGGIWEELTAQSGLEGDRTVLVYGTVHLSETMKERIVSFNKNNPDYYITVKEYDGKTMSDRRLQMQAAVTSGNGPDILDLYTYCVENYMAYAENGYLEDLEPYLLSEDFGDDIIWPLQELYRVNGKVCMAVPHFTMRGIAINPEYAAKTENWSFAGNAEKRVL